MNQDYTNWGHKDWCKTDGNRRKFEWARLVKRLSLCCLAILGVLIVTAIGLYWSWVRIASNVKIFTPPGWPALEGRTELMVFPDRDVLLIRRARTEEGKPTSSPDESEPPDMPGLWSYYKYDPAAETIEIVSSDHWNNAQVYITRCGIEVAALFVQFDTQSVYGVDFNKKMKTFLKKGTKSIRWVLSPSVEACSTDEWSPLDERLAEHRRCIADRRASGPGFVEKPMVVLVSADPDMQMGGLMGGMVRGSSRQHYHHVVSLADATLVGKRLRIPMVTRLAGRQAKPGRDKFVDICWSADERYVVYIGRTSLCVVPVEHDENN